MLKRVSNPEIIRWTPNERLIVAEESLRLRQLDESLSPAMAVRQAQAKLPEERRRPSFRDWKKTASWLLPLWDDLSAQMKRGKPDSAQAPLALADAPTLPELPPAGAKVAAGENAAPRPAIEAEAPALQAAPEEAPKEAPAAAAPVPDSAADSEPAPTGGEAGQDGEHKRVVRWSQEERERIARRSRELRQKFDLEPLDAVRAATFELPDDRQRDITHIGLVTDWLLPMWADLDRAEREAKEAQERAERERAEQEAQEAARIAEEARQREAEIEQAVGARLSATTFDALLKQLGQKIAASLMENVSASLEAAITARVAAAMSSIPAAAVAAQAMEGVTKVALPPRERLPRIAVCGLLNQEIAEVKRAFDGQADITFIKNHVDTGNVGPKVKHVDVTVVMASHCNHTIQGELKRAGVKPIYVNGTLSALRRWLQQWLNGEIALAS